MTSKRLLRTSFLATAACVIVLTQVAVSAPADIFTTEDGAVSFWAPLPPKKSIAGVPDNGVEFPRTIFTMKAPNYTIQTTIFELGDFKTTGDEDAYLKTFVDTLLGGLGPDFVLDKVGGRAHLPLGPNGLKGIQLTGTKGAVQAIIRIYIGTCRFYQFQILHEAGNKVTGQLGERYFSSVTISDSTTKLCVISPS